MVVSGQKWLGGLTIQTALLCRELERLGHRVAVVSIGAPAVVDQFEHAEIRHGNGHGSLPGWRETGGRYVFRYEVVADAARYLPPGGLATRTALAPIARLGMAIVTPPRPVGRAPLTHARGAASSFMRGVMAALDAGLSGGAADAPFLARLLLNTDRHDLDRLETIRDWFQPDAEYACDLALVPMMARLRDRGIPLVAAAQGFELVHRKGIGLVEALERMRHRLDLIISGSQANVDENLDALPMLAEWDVPVEVIPYGVALDGGWEMDREAAVRRMRDLERHLTWEQRGDGGLWGSALDLTDEFPRPFIITAFSRLDVEKGADLSLHALSILRRQGVPAHLWIAGNAMPGSAFLEVLRQKIRLMDLTEHVSLIGTLQHQLDKVALLRASDAFVAGFIRSEPFGLVYTEAMATSLPMVAPDTGAGPELMRYAGDTSTLYPANDTGALADRLLQLATSREKREHIACLERRAFETRFNATMMAEAASNALEAAISRRCGQPHAG